MLSVVLKCIRSTSSLQAVIPLVCVAKAALGSHKSYRSMGRDATPYTASLSALLDRGMQVSVLEFEISASEAVRRFEDYQRKACMYLHAHSLIKPPPQQEPQTSRSGHPRDDSFAAAGPDAASGVSSPGSAARSSSLTTAYLPYWCFDATFNCEAYAKLGFKDDKTGEMVWKDMADPLPLSSRAVAPASDPAMQVYAGYKYVRDVGGGAAGPSLPLRARPLSWAEAEAGAVGGVGLHRADMRQGLAWQLALRALTHQQLVAAEGAVRAATGATDLSDVRVSMQVLSRSARLVFLPAYIAVYQYGTRYKQGTSGVIVPQIFTAVVGGTAHGRVVAPQHLSPAKASLSTGGLVGGLGLLAGDISSWAPSLMGLESLLPQLGAVEAITLAALAASGAGLWAHQRPQTQRAHQTAKQVRADFEFYKKYDIHETHGSGAAAAADARRADEAASAVGGGAGGTEEYVLWLWADADWRRWEEDEPWNWEEDERRKWAEELWRKQAARRLERQRYVERMAAEARRREEEAEAEARREQRYGGGARTSYSHHRPRDHGMGGDEGAGAHSGGEGYGRRRRRSDFLGYYRVLGLQDAEAVSSEDIKQAFKLQALLLHPDKHVGAEPEAQRAALVQFQKLQIAYDTLKDAEKRRLYDRGQLVH